MAACGASDSVITHTSISEELQVPLLLLLLLFSSLFLSSGGGGGRFCSTESCFFLFLSTISSLCITSVTGGLLQRRHWPMRMERNGGREALRSLSFHFTRERRCSFNIRPGEEGDLSYPSCTRICLMNIYLHTLLFCLERGKTILQKKKKVLVVAWLQLFVFLSLPFMVSAKHSGLKWGEKSDDPLSFKSNQFREGVSFYRNDWISEGLVFVCLSGLKYF